MSRNAKEKMSKFVQIIDDFSKTSLVSSEANTKKKVIEPLLERLGWNFSSDEVHLEFPVKIGTRTNHVDYALILEGKTTAFIEAKAFDTILSEDNSNQIISYGKVDDVRWVALTNGKIIKVFDTSAGKTEKECLIGEINLLKLPQSIEELNLIHRDSIFSGEIESAARRLSETRRAIQNLKKKRNQLAEEFEKSLLNITGEVVKQRVQNISTQLIDHAIHLFETQIEVKGEATPQTRITSSITRDVLSSLPPGEVIVCPSKPDGVEFLKKYNAWGYINMSGKRHPKYFALYVGSPESSVKFLGEIESITKPLQSLEEVKLIERKDWETFETGKRVIHLKTDSLIELKNPIPLKSKRRGLRGIKYSSLEKMIKAEKLSDL